MTQKQAIEKAEGNYFLTPRSGPEFPSNFYEGAKYVCTNPSENQRLKDELDSAKDEIAEFGHHERGLDLKIQSLQQQLTAREAEKEYWIQQSKHYEQQLAEKDKEIDRLKGELEKKFSEGYEYCKQYYKIND